MAFELAAFALVVLVGILVWKIHALQKKIQELAFGKQSQSVRYGKMSEQFMPFLKEYPYQAESFRFLGTPIDGVQFEKDKIVFVEFKTGDSRLSVKQKEIKDIVLKKNVEWKEVRIS